MAARSNGPLNLDEWNRMIAEAKARYSCEVGRDVGVPYTVDMLLRRSGELTALEGAALYDVMDTDLMALGDGDYERLVGGYLFWAEGHDDHGRTPCEGELRRFIAKEIEMPPEAVSISPARVRHYLEDHELPIEWLPELMARVSHEDGYQELVSY